MSVHLFSEFCTARFAVTDRTKCSVELRTMWSRTSMEVPTLHRTLESLPLRYWWEGECCNTFEEIEWYLVTLGEGFESACNRNFTKGWMLGVIHRDDDCLVAVDFFCLDLSNCECRNADERHRCESPVVKHTGHFEFSSDNSSHGVWRIDIKMRGCKESSKRGWLPSNITIVLQKVAR